MKHKLFYKAIDDKVSMFHLEPNLTFNSNKTILQRLLGVITAAIIILLIYHEEISRKNSIEPLSNSYPQKETRYNSTGLIEKS